MAIRRKHRWEVGRVATVNHVSERWPADALVRALRGRTVTDASCDGEGMDDVRLRLDDGTVVTVDATVVDTSGPLELGPRGRLVVRIGSLDLWSHSKGPTPPQHGA